MTDSQTLILCWLMLVDLVLSHCNRGQVESSHRPSHIWISIYQMDLGLLLLCF